MGRPPGKTYSMHVALRLDPGLRDALAKAAKEEERSLAQMIRMLLRDGLAVREEKRGGAAAPKRRGKSA
jgi:hypothetical protein